MNDSEKAKKGKYFTQRFKSMIIVNRTKLGIFSDKYTERVKEIARMASGNESSATIKNAFEMLSSAKKLIINIGEKF